MSLHPIDDLFRKRFRNAEEQYPEHLWSNISDELHGKKSNRKYGGFWFKWAGTGLLFLIALGLVGYLYIDSSSGLPNEVNKKATSGELDGHVIENNEAGNRREDITSSLDKSTMESGDLNNDVSLNNIKKEILEIYKGDTKTDSNSEFIEIKTSSSNLSNNSSLIGSSKVSGNTGSLKQAISQQLNRSDIESGKSFLIDNEGFIATSVRKMVSVSDLSSVSHTGQRRIQFDESKDYRRIENYKTNIRYGANSIRLKWTLSGFYAYNLIDRTLSGKTNDDEALRLYRDDHESLSNAFSLGLNIGLNWHSWSILTGIHYSQINDRFEYTVDNSKQVVNGQMVFGELKKSIVNRYSSINIPLLFQYEKGYNNWRIGILAGAEFNINHQITGQLFDEDVLDIVELNGLERGYYKSSLGIIPSAGIFIGYKWNYNSTVFLRPMFNYLPESITESSYKLEHELNIITIAAGLRYNLN